MHLNRTASCKVEITVEDREPPRITGCPQGIEKTLAPGRSNDRVFWKEPVFNDNVELVDVYKSRVSPGHFNATRIYYSNFCRNLVPNLCLVYIISPTWPPIRLEIVPAVDLL